jgi:hypothetical protein
MVGQGDYLLCKRRFNGDSRSRHLAQAGRFRAPLTQPPPLHEPTESPFLKPDDAAQIAGPDLPIAMGSAAGTRSTRRIGGKRLRVGVIEACRRRRGRARVADGVVAVASLVPTIEDIGVDAEGHATGSHGGAAGAAAGDGDGGVGAVFCVGRVRV